MRAFLFGLLAALSVGACETAQPPSARFTAAIADPGRPAADAARDVNRKPADMLAFAEVRPGARIGELIPGGGYFTRIFAKAVGPAGRVYAITPAMGGADARPADAGKPSAIQVIAADPAYANVTVLTQDFTAIAAPEPLDMVWTSQNYHDLHLARFKLDVAAVNKAIYASLKPGGLYIVLDHAAAAGAGIESADQLHRIDPAIVKREVTAAGFVFVGETSVLRNPADDHTLKVFDPAIRGKTDQFVYKFKKPR